MKKNSLWIIIVLFITACSPFPGAVDEAVSKTLTAYPTDVPNPTATERSTFTPYPTYTPYPTLTEKVVIVTPTFTATPLFTSTITMTPTVTPTFTKTIPPTATPDPLQASKGPGNYLIGVDIAPGVWRSQGKADGCYWEVTTKTGDIISNDFGAAGGTMYIPATGFQVEMSDDCGDWVFLSK